MKAIGTRVIIKQDEPKIEKGGIYLPQGKEEWSNVGTVVSLGSQVQADLRPGDRVVFLRQPDSALARWVAATRR